MSFVPVFVPVLHHSFRDDGMQRVDALLRGRKIGSSPGCAYGGLVFTSQRAVEGFAKLVEDGKGGWGLYRIVARIFTFLFFFFFFFTDARMLTEYAGG